MYIFRGEASLQIFFILFILKLLFILFSIRNKYRVTARRIGMAVAFIMNCEEPPKNVICRRIIFALSAVTAVPPPFLHRSLINIVKATSMSNIDANSLFNRVPALVLKSGTSVTSLPSFSSQSDAQTLIIKILWQILVCTPVIMLGLSTSGCFRRCFLMIYTFWIICDQLKFVPQKSPFICAFDTFLTWYRSFIPFYGFISLSKCQVEKVCAISRWRFVRRWRRRERRHTTRWLMNWWQSSQTQGKQRKEI